MPACVHGLSDFNETLPPVSSTNIGSIRMESASASIVLCRDCGRAETCPDCDRPLVYHEAAAVLRCHQCGASAPVPHRCRDCGSSRIRYLGGGTERIEREVRDRFPDLRVGRLDRDVVERRGERSG